MSENGFPEYKRDIYTRLEKLEQGLWGDGGIESRVRELETAIANMRGRVFVWGTIAGTLFGAAMSLFVMVVARAIGR